MISDEAFSLNFKIINISYFFCLIPFYWDKKRKLLVESKVWYKLWIWKLQVALVWFYLGYLYLRLAKTLITGEEASPVNIILFLDWIATLSIIAVSDLTSVWKRKQLIQLVNSLLIFNGRLEEQLKKSDRKKSLDILKYFFKFSLLSIVGNCIGPAVLYALTPCNPRYFSAGFLEDCKQITKPQLTFFFFVEVYYFLHAVCTIYVCVFQIALVQFGFIETLKTLLRIPLKKECCLELHRHATIYRQLQFLNVMFHDVFRFLFLPGILLACIVVGVLSFGGIIKLHSIIGLGSIAGFSTMAFACATVLTATTFITGRSDELSKLLFIHWKKADKNCKSVWMKRFIKSDSTIRCWVGGYKIRTFTQLECTQFAVGQIASFCLIFQ